MPDINLLSQPVVAGAIAGATTVVGLMTRFSQRRLFNSRICSVLFVTIVVLSTAAAIGISLTPGSTGVLGVGVALPFCVPQPGSEPGSDGDLKPNSGGAGFGAAVVKLLWSITGFLTKALDQRLSTHKSLTVGRLKSEYVTAYSGNASLLDTLQAMLKKHAENIVDKEERQARLGRLAADYHQATESGTGDPEQLVSLVYDWKLEKYVSAVFRTATPVGGNPDTP